MTYPQLTNALLLHGPVTLAIHRPRRRFNDPPRETRPRKQGVRDVEVTWPPAPIVLPREAK